MTSQPQPTPGEGRPAGQILRPLRDLAAYALVGAAAVLLFVAVLELIPTGDGQFSYRTQGSFGNFVNLETILFPLGAVLLAVAVRPRHPKARLIVIAAVAEYGVAAFFAVIFGVLIGLINTAADNGAFTAFEGLLTRVAWLAVFAVAAYATFLIWRNLFYTPKPTPQPGMYGTPQYGHPGAFPGQPGYGPPPGQPGYPPQGGFPPAPGQQGYGPGVYGQQGPAWNQPSGPFPAAQPTQPVPPGPFVPQPAGPPAGSPVGPPPGTVYPGTPQPGSPQTVVPQAGYVYPGSPQPTVPADEPRPGSPAGPPPAATPVETQPVPSGPPAAWSSETQPVSSGPPAAWSSETQPVSSGSPAASSSETRAVPAAEPTQVVPAVQPSPLDDRTQKLSTERPGPGPADPEAPQK